MKKKRLIRNRIISAGRNWSVGKKKDTYSFKINVSYKLFIYKSLTRRHIQKNGLRCAYSLTHTHTHTHTLSVCLSVCLTLSLSHSQTHTHTHTHTYIYIYIYICIYIYEVHTVSFQTFFVWAFKIGVDSWKFGMLLIYILWDDRSIFRISGSN